MGWKGKQQDLDSKFFELVLKLDTAIQGGLASEGHVNSVRAFVLDDLSDKLWGHWKEVDLVRESL